MTQQATPGAEFANRLRKNARHFGRWAARQQLTAYRVYDRDLPDWSFVVEWYAGRVHLVEYPRRRAAEAQREAQRRAVWDAVVTELKVAPEQIFTKTHLPQPWGRSQYGRLGAQGERFQVRENGLSFWVNLSDRLDTGLFLDHRNTRARVRAEAQGKRVLNLFSYTGSFTVYAAAGGAARTVSVDLSNTYCDWARDNLSANALAGPRHQVVRGDAREWLAAYEGEPFDLVVLDPPPFSSSKAMSGRFDVQKDHVALLLAVLQRVAPGGALYFSTNYRGFRLDAERLSSHRFEELTPAILPSDVHEREALRCWRVTPGAT